MKQIFQQVKPSFLVGTGNSTFFDELVLLLDPTLDKKDYQKFKVSKKKAANADSTNVSFYQLNRGKQDELQNRIYELNLPGIMTQSTKEETVHFINSILPMKQELVVACLGNLLKYLNDNHLKWQNAFIAYDKNPMITNVIISTLEAQVLIDEFSFNSLNIFSNINHPSSFKLQVRKDGLSLFNLLNHCASSVGVQELKTILRQPTRDIQELNIRLTTVEWCMAEKNLSHVQRFRGFLGGLINIQAAFRRIMVNHGNSFVDWKSFKRTIFNINTICHLSSTLSNDQIKGTILIQLASFHKEGVSINGVLFGLERIVDIEATETKKRFCVKKDLDLQLDEKKAALDKILEDFNGMELDESLLKINNTHDTFSFVHYKEIGFVVGSVMKLDQMNLESIKDDGIELVLNTTDARYFKTPNCQILDDEYEKQLACVIQHEMDILKKLIKYINENFAEISEAAKICSKFDCLIAFSIVAKKQNYVKPTIKTDHTLTIVKGRHPLLEVMKTYVASTTTINEQNKSFINVIRAPNSSGKSCYIKQIALICFMVHIGCFVPAESCAVSLLHSIFTRIYTPESLFLNESAFMSDLEQMSKIVMNSTNRSLVLIDEFAKGTFYKDGIAILTAVIEHFAGREHLSPFVFAATHYPQIKSMVHTTSGNFTCFKSIITKKNPDDIFHSSFELTDESNNQECCTEYPESKSIILNIFNNKQRDDELKVFNEATAISIKAFILILCKMMLRKNFVTYDFIRDIYTKVDIENFLNL